REIFETPQLSQLAALIKQSQSLSRTKITAISREDGKPIPSSFAQQRLWFIDQMDGGSAHYNMPSAMRLQGDFNIDAAQQAFTKIIQRHESLRTVFVEGDGSPLQLIKDSFSFKITQQNLTNLNKKAQKKAIKQAMHKDAESSFDLSQDLMLRVSYLELANDKGILLFNMHHIASDGWSIAILINEFVNLYESIITGKACALATLPIQYGDYAHWQRNYLQGEVLDKQLSYWGEQLAELPQLHSLPLDYERPDIQTFNGAVHHFTLDKTTLKSLKNIALDNQVTLFMLMHAAFAIVLSRYSNCNDIIIGSPVANRMQKELEYLIGFFVNTMVLRVDCSGDPSFEQFLQAVKKVNLDAQTNQDIPFEHLVDHLNPSRSTSHNALFQILFSMNTNEEINLSLADIKLSGIDNDLVTSKFDLSLFAAENDGLDCVFEYNTDLFAAQTIAQFASSLQQLLIGISKNAKQQLSQLSLLTDKDRTQLICLSQNSAQYPQHLCIHQLFEQQAQNNPDQIALVFQEQALTYQQLNQQANQLAHYLLEQNIAPGDIIGLCMHRSMDMIVALLAILKAGAAYLPLDTELP
ncbi:MAG TPA: non-ribosomal peptide synthetase, partial [Oceanospirillales bacterium]|nr:non-ribosomal peptide synthetase [Oceanospirillales bacterium]